MGGEEFDFGMEKDTGGGKRPQVDYKSGDHVATIRRIMWPPKARKYVNPKGQEQWNAKVTVCFNPDDAPFDDDYVFYAFNIGWDESKVPLHDAAGNPTVITDEMVRLAAKPFAIREDVTFQPKALTFAKAIGRLKGADGKESVNFGRWIGARCKVVVENRNGNNGPYTVVTSVGYDIDVANAGPAPVRGNRPREAEAAATSAQPAKRGREPISTAMENVIRLQAQAIGDCIQKAGGSVKDFMSGIKARVATADPDSQGKLKDMDLSPAMDLLLSLRREAQAKGATIVPMPDAEPWAVAIVESERIAGMEQVAEDQPF